MSRPLAVRHASVALRSPRPLLSLFSTVAFCFGAAWLWGCSSENPTLNQPPTVELTAGPAEGDTVRFNIPISWSGEDSDGSIIRYEYAVDPDSAFTEDEIAKGGPGIVSVLVKGKNGAPDTTRVTNNSGASFDWIHTQETSHRFQFSTPIADSTYAHGMIVPTGRFFGIHAVYVRAVDNEQACSLPDKVAFTAKTVAPRSRILSPDLHVESGITLANKLNVRWNGTDPDGTQRRPVAYEIALVRLDPPPFPCICDPFPIEALLRNRWVRVTGTSLSTDTLTVPAQYFFGVHAVDDNGVVEPFLDWGRNVFSFQTRTGAGSPQLSVSFGSIVYTFPTPGFSGSIQVPSQRKIRMSLSCSAEAYGQSCAGIRWGSDLNNLGDWTTEDQPDLFFNSAGAHVFYIQARDDLGSVTTATLIFNVIAFSFDREVLIVDDSLDNLSPNDSEHDAFWQDMVSYYTANSDVPPEQFEEFAVFGDGDRGNLQPSVPTLSDLAKYKVVVWENLGSGYNSESGLYRATILSPLLRMYLQAGGKLWLDGRMTIAATTSSPYETGADLTYPKTELDPGDFAWDILKLHSSKINNDKGANNANLFHAARAFPGRPAVYDTMSVDLAKLSVFQQGYGGFSYADAVLDPNFAESEPAFRGDIDTLYAYGASGPEVLGKTSQYQNRLCAIRWHDPDPNREHGRVQWFGFSLYFMHQDQARNTFKASLDWLRQESPAP